MTEEVSNNKSSVREIIRRFNMLGKANGSSFMPMRFKNNSHSTSSISMTSSSTISEYISSSNEISAVTMNHQTSVQQRRPSIPSTCHINIEPLSIPTYASPVIINKNTQVPVNDDIGLEVIESVQTRETHANTECSSSMIEDYEESDIQQQPNDLYPTVSRRPPPLPPSVFSLPNVAEESKRSLPLSNFLLEFGALIVVFILSMVLVLAIRDQSNLRTTMQVVYTYIYIISIIWMVWCTFDIIKFRKQWMKLTSSAHNQEEYMDIVEQYPHKILYFPDIHNTGGLFMRIGAGLFCMGSFLLTIIELAKTIEMIRIGPKYRGVHSMSYSQPVFVTKSIMFIFRLLFHCIQFIFLFRYGNIIIDRYHFISRLGLIHIVIANLCTWFDAIVIETLEQLHHLAGITISTNIPMSIIATTTTSVNNFLPEILAAAPAGETSTNTSLNTPTTVLEFIEKIELTMSVYLYPCLIEYSLISLTVFYIMWRNVGKTENRSYLHFADRHVFTVNCSRASYGLLTGGIMLLLTILTLIPVDILHLGSAITITRITELVLLIISLLIVCMSFFYTTKLYYDREAHVDVFDQILILITTVGDFAYSLFGLFASIFIESYTINIPRVIEITISLLAICQTFLQSGFILDTLKRRSRTKNEIRKKPGRELITALLLINLAIWLHDSLSAKKVKLNPLQTEYYDARTWAIVQAFTSPLSIFYRFHSSVCLADIWQEIYHNHGKTSSGKKDGIGRLTNNNQH